MSLLDLDFIEVIQTPIALGPATSSQGKADPHDHGIDHHIQDVVREDKRNKFVNRLVRFALLRMASVDVHR